MAVKQDAESDERDEELTEERKAADGKPRRLMVEVTQLPVVKRGKDDQVTSVVVTGKARFKGEVILRLKGDVASAYWSVTPGMKLSALAYERDDKDYDVDQLDVLPAL